MARSTVVGQAARTWLAVMLCIVLPLAGILIVNVLAASTMSAWPAYPLPLLFGLGFLLVRRYRAYGFTVLAAALPLVVLWVVAWVTGWYCPSIHEPTCGDIWLIAAGIFAGLWMLAVLIGSSVLVARDARRIERQRRPDGSTRNPS